MDDLVERLLGRSKECASAVGEPPLDIVAILTKADGLLMKEAAAEITRLREANTRLDDECNKSMIEIENLRRDIETARREALEEVLEYYDSEIKLLEEQIERNYDYMKKMGYHDEESNSLCRSKIRRHQMEASRIRALIQPNTSPS